LKPAPLGIGHSVQVKNAEQLVLTRFYHPTGGQQIRAAAITPEYLVSDHFAATVTDDKMRSAKHFGEILIAETVPVG